MKYRLDWKIAFGLPIDFAGIHNTTLVLFRDRLIENEKSSYAFDKILDHLTSLGLIKKGQKQRIDSTHVIGNVRELIR
jgi:transposase